VMMMIDVLRLTFYSEEGLSTHGIMQEWHPIEAHASTAGT